MITLATLKSELGVTGETHDEVLERLIARTTSVISRELGRWVGPPKQLEEILNGGGNPLVFVNSVPVVGGEVTVSTRYSPTSDWEVLEEELYALEGRKLWHRSRWPCGQANVRVNYTGGYTPGDNVPGELEDLALELMTLKWRARGKEGLASESLGDYSYSRRDLESLDSWRRTIRRYRRLRV